LISYRLAPALSQRRTERRRVERMRSAERDVHHDQPGAAEDARRPDRTRSSGCRCAAISRATAARLGRRRSAAAAGEGQRHRFRLRSDAGLRSRGNVFYGYIVVFFGNGNGVNGTAMAVARSTDGGKHVSAVHAVLGGGRRESLQRQADDHRRHEPGEPVPRLRLHRLGRGDRRVDRRRRAVRALDRSRRDVHGHARRRSARTGPRDRRCPVRRSERRSVRRVERLRREHHRLQPLARRRRHVGHAAVVASKQLPFDIAIPAEFNRGALVYPACDGPIRRRASRTPVLLVDGSASAGNTDIFRRSPTMGHDLVAAEAGHRPLPASTASTTGCRSIRSPARRTSRSTTRATTRPGWRFMTDIYFTQSRRRRRRRGSRRTCA
jgi:hypothetical protein